MSDLRTRIAAAVDVIDPFEVTKAGRALREVLKLHVPVTPEGGGITRCAECHHPVCEPIPCSTVEAIRVAFGVAVEPPADRSQTTGGTT